jgi:Tol biopolymer transport system component
MSRIDRAPDEFDLLLTAWFEGDARVREPETLLDGVIARTTRVRPLPTWRLPERWIPMDIALRLQPRPRLMPILLALLLAAALIAGALLIGSERSTRLPPPFGIARNGQIVYISGEQLYRADGDGSDAVALTTPENGVASPIFSRDGTRFAYRVLHGGSLAPTSVDMVIAKADGSEPITIDQGATAMTNPNWSSDGQWLTYVRYVGPDPFASDASHLIVVRTDGSDPVDLVNLRLGVGVWGPSFSPDGSMIAFSAMDGSLYVVDRDGTGLRELTKDTYPSVGFKGLSAVWSPDGQTLLFGAGVQDVVDQTIYIVGLDGAPERPFSPSRDNQDDAVFSPDGKHVAFLQEAFEDRGPIVVIADATGHVLHALPGIYAWHMPEWSPDGTKVAILDSNPDTPDAPPGQAAIVILDAFGNAEPTFIYIPGYEDNGRHPDYTMTWQRLALPG